MTKSKFKPFFCIMLVLGLVSLVSACSSPTITTQPTSQTATSYTTPTEELKYGGVYYKITTQDVTSPWGWPAKLVPRDLEQASLCLDTLLQQNDQAEMQPWLAESWEIASDMSSITLNLRKDVRFHDGTDFNADAAKWNLDTVLEAGISGTNTWSSIEVLDDYTIRINLTQWNNQILTYLARTPGLMISPTAVKQNGQEWAEQNPVGTGAFKFVSRVSDTSIEWERNNDYWQAGIPYLDGIKYIVMSDMMTQIAALKSGQGDELSTFAATQISDLEEWGAQVYYKDDGILTLWPDAANTDSPFSNLLVRQAINYAIDRDSIANALGYDIFTAAEQFALPNSLCEIPSLSRPYDPEKAKQLLDQAGYSDGFDCTLLTLNAFKDTAVAVQQQWAKIGINAQVKVMTDSESTVYQTQGWHNACLVMAGSSYANGVRGVSEMLLNPNFLVSVGLSDKAISLYNESLLTVNLEKENVQKLYQEIFDDARVVPIMYVGTAHIVNPNIILYNHGFFTKFSVSGWTPEKMWIERK